MKTLWILSCVVSFLFAAWVVLPFASNLSSPYFELATTLSGTLGLALNVVVGTYVSRHLSTLKLQPVGFHVARLPGYSIGLSVLSGGIMLVAAAPMLMVASSWPMDSPYQDVVAQLVCLLLFLAGVGFLLSLISLALNRNWQSSKSVLISLFAGFVVLSVAFAWAMEGFRRL